KNIQSIVAGERSEPVALASAPISAETEQTAVEPDVSVSGPMDVAEDTAEAVVEAQTTAHAESAVDHLEHAVAEHVEHPDDDLRSLMEETFLEESEEILEHAVQLLNQWTEQRSDRNVLLQLQRAAHSIKGGARMVENEP